MKAHIYQAIQLMKEGDPSAALDSLEQVFSTVLSSPPYHPEWDSLYVEYIILSGRLRRGLGNETNVSREQLDVLQNQVALALLSLIGEIKQLESFSWIPTDESFPIMASIEGVSSLDADQRLTLEQELLAPQGIVRHQIGDSEEKDSLILQLEVKPHQLQSIISEIKRLIQQYDGLHDIQITGEKGYLENLSNSMGVSISHTRFPEPFTINYGTEDEEERNNLFIRDTADLFDIQRVLQEHGWKIPGHIKLYEDYKVWVIRQQFGIRNNTDNWLNQIQFMGLHLTIAESHHEEVGIVDLLPKTHLIQKHASRLQLVSSIGYSGRFTSLEADVSTENHKYFTLANGGELTLHSSTASVGTLSFEVPTPQVEVFGQGGVEGIWQFSQEDGISAGIYDTFFSLLLPDYLEEIDYQISAFVGIKSFDGLIEQRQTPWQSVHLAS